MGREVLEEKSVSFHRQELLQQVKQKRENPYPFHSEPIMTIAGAGKPVIFKGTVAAEHIRVRSSATEISPLSLCPEEARLLQKTSESLTAFL